MKGIFIWIISAILFLGTAQIGTEVALAFLAHDTLKDRIITMSLDALELSADDTLRMEHVTICDVVEAEGIFRSWFFHIVEDDSLSGVAERILEHVELIELHGYAGAYEVKDGTVVQTEEPYLKFKGNLHVRLGIMEYERRLVLPLEVMTMAHRAQ